MIPITEAVSFWSFESVCELCQISAQDRRRSSFSARSLSHVAASDLDHPALLKQQLHTALVYDSFTQTLRLSLCSELRVFLSPDWISWQTEKGRGWSWMPSFSVDPLPLRQQPHTASFWLHNGQIFLSFLLKMFILKMITFLALLCQAFTILQRIQSKEQISFWIIPLCSDKVYQ